jgi:hypothetical protein
MPRNVTSWVSVAAALGVLSGAACGGSALHDPAAIRGRVAAAVADRADGSCTRHYIIELDDGSERKLVFAGDEPALQVGEEIEVRGTLTTDSIAVESFTRVAPPQEASLGAAQSLLSESPRRPPRRMALVLVDPGTGLGDMTKEKAKAALLGNGDLDNPHNTSLARYYDQSSYHEQTLTGDVVGPLRFDIGQCDTAGMASTLRAQVAGTYDQYAWYFPMTPACDWSGLGAEGTPERPARNTWFNGSLGCVVFAQEPGHNFGMQHSSSMNCGRASFTDAPEGACVHSEYGDPYDPMGSGCYHLNMYQKQHQGWLGGCNSVKVTSSATFDVFPEELPCDAVQVLQIPMPKARAFSHTGGGSQPATDQLAYYYIEYRHERPFDDPNGTVLEGVQIRAAEDYAPPSEVGHHSWLLDMQPGSSRWDLAPGQTFRDPAGSPSITVLAVDQVKATIRVEFEGGGAGAPRCLDGTELTPPGPGTCGASSVSRGEGAATPATSQHDGDGGPSVSDPDADAASGSACPAPLQGTSHEELR